MGKSGKWILIIVGLLTFLFIAWKMVGSKKKIEKVATSKAIRRTIIESVNSSGKIYPETQVTISPDFSGQVTSLNVKEGDTVRKGAALASINNRTTITSPIDGIVLSLKVKKGESVTGNNFSIGTVMMIIADMSTLEIKADIGESDINKIHKNDSVDITVDAYDKRKFKGWITAVPASPKTSTGFGAVSNDVTEYEVRIKLDKESYKDLEEGGLPFRPGMNARVDIRTKKMENVLAVPVGAVNARVKGSDKSMAEKKKEDQQNKGNEGLMEDPANDDDGGLEEVAFVLQKDGTVKKAVVKTGIQDTNYFEIISGLNEGDEVVTDPYTALSKTLKDGMKVKVVPKSKLFQN